ncbi:hypothetical protein HN682_08190 [Candidatus Peregrinibacteria bacterium]|jgi:hypothetical protein|nr:hypothetical protein [Candidatus Peregrinibacteria bacterium]
MIFIPGNVPSSKNAQQPVKVGGRYIILPKKSVQSYRKNTADYWKLYKDDFKNSILGKGPPYRIAFQFIRKSRHKFDYINPLQTIQDEMAKHGWLEDDNADELLPILLPYKYDKENPGVIISVV